MHYLLNGFEIWKPLIQLCLLIAELIEVKRSLRPFETNKNSRIKLNALISSETKTIHKISSKTEHSVFTSKFI